MVYGEICQSCWHHRTADDGDGYIDEWCDQEISGILDEKVPLACPIHGELIPIDQLDERVTSVKSKIKWVTNIKITAFDLDGNIKDVTEIKNLLVTDGLGMVVDAWQTAAFDSEIKDMALGRGAAAPALTDTQLGNETYRMAFTSQAEVTATSLLSIAVVPAASAVGLIEEIGWFAGVNAAGATPNQGILVSRVLYNRTKTTLESLSIERTDTIAEA